MRYQNSYSAKSNRKRRLPKTTIPKASSPRRSWVKTISIVFTFVVLLYGLKLLLTPIVKTLASVWEESSTAISFMLPGGAEVVSDTHGHTNVMLVGIDRRSYQPYQYDGPDGAIVRNGFLADTIIVASVNRELGTLSMISLPRDLWVKVPAYENLYEQHTKINAVHALGDRYYYPDDGGMGLLKGIVENVTGLPIHYWARVDFEAFVQGIEAVDGVDIYVEQAFDDYMYPRAGFEDAAWNQRYEHLHFDEGWQYMDGETALKFARSRHALGPEGSDFARSARQQKVVKALIDKAMTSETLFNLDRVRNLYGALSENVATNIGPGDLPLFYRLAKNIGQLNLEGYVLGSADIDPPLLYAPDPGYFGGAYVLIPTAGQDNYVQVHAWVENVVYGMRPTIEETPESELSD